MPAPPHGLQIGAAAGSAALTPAQKRFNTLIRKIDEARQALADWQAQIPLYRQRHAQLLGPLLTELTALRERWVDRLDSLLAEPGWSKADRATLRALLCDTVAELLADQDPPDPALKALFDRHAEVDYDTEQQQVRLAMKDMVEAMTGVDLGEARDITSDEDLYQRLEAEMAAQAAQAQAREQAKAARRKTGAQARREAEAQDATQSVREVYRRLASALHPDREADPAQQAAKTALMQRANQAYAANDLLSLLTLQLEIEQVDADHLARASAAQIKRYNAILQEQLSELQRELLLTEEGFRHEAGLEPGWGLKPAKLGALVKTQARDLNLHLRRLQHDLRMLDEPAMAKRWLKLVRQHQREAEADAPFI
ncbi:MAG: J domain-containing protein [Burkholderiales bacterium]|nr:J domain-containing protein [Burkholderiales bacterium]